MDFFLVFNTFLPTFSLFFCLLFIFIGHLSYFLLHQRQTNSHFPHVCMSKTKE
jgi:hypothetical protein